MATAAAASSSSTSNTHSSRPRRNSRRSAAHRAEPEAAHAPESSDGPAPPLLQQQQSETTDQQEDAAAAAAKEKKSAWNRPSNGVVEVGPVMGAVSWPALSEAARASPRSLSSDSLVALSDGSVSAPASSVVANPPPPPPKPVVSNNPNPNASANHGPTRQKSMKRGGGGGGGGGNGNSNNTGGGGVLANGGPVPPCPPASAEAPKMASDRPTVPELSPREQPIRNSGVWDHGSRSGGFLPQNHGGNEHHRNYNHRRGNAGGGGSDGGNSHHNSYGARRNHDRGGYEWNSHRNFPGRDIPLQQPHPPRLPQRPFIVPQPVSAPFISPSPAVRPFGSPIGFHDMPTPLVYMPGPFVPPSVFYQAPDPQLPGTLLKQIEYYFSPENLCKDIFLRQNMEEEGWVSVSMISNFNRIKLLTNNIRFILDTVRTSSVLEVQGDKIRRRNDWTNWILPPPANQSISASSSDSPPQAMYDIMATRVNNLALEMGAINQDSLRSPAPSDLVLDRSSGKLNSQPQVTGNLTGDGIGKSSGQLG